MKNLRYTIFKVLLFPTITTFLFLSCNKYISKFEPEPESDKPMGELIVPEGFNFETSNVVKIDFHDNLKTGDTARYKIYLHSEQVFVDTNVYTDDNGEEITELIDAPDPTNSLIATKVSSDGIFTLLTNIPTYIDKLYVVKNTNGVFTSEILQINEKHANYGGGAKAFLDDPTYILYGVNRNGDLFTINPISGELVVIDELVSNSHACAMDKVNRILYTVGINRRLYKYFIDSEVFELVGNVRIRGNRLDFNEDDGLLYYSNRDRIYSIDPSNARVLTQKRIKGFHDKRGGDLLFDTNGTLYVVTNSGLYRIIFNQEEASAVRVSTANLPFNATSLAFDSQNQFWLATKESHSQLVNINKITGAWEYRFSPYDIRISDLTTLPLNQTGIPQTDTDGDGIIDFYDEFPYDANKAYSIYSPSVHDVGTLAFEDNWPAQGDYDFNDLVVNYQFITILNADDQVVELDCSFTIKHIGASYINGFGFELPFNASLIESVMGFNITGNVVTINGKGLETSQSKPVVIVCDNVNANAYQELNIVISLNSPVSPDIIGTPPFNPFIFVNQDRSKEVHLPNYPPTSLADFIFFNTEDDTSNPPTGRYYKTINNLPWAIQISQEFKYPKESKPVNNGYLKFNSWAESGGNLYKDWYIDLDGYRDNDHLNSNN